MCATGDPLFGEHVLPFSPFWRCWLQATQSMTSLKRFHR